MLEAEAFNLRNKKPNNQSQIRTRAQRARVVDPEDSDAEDVAEIRKDKQSKITEVPESSTTPQPTPQPITTPEASSSTVPDRIQTQSPEHPYSNVKDAIYHPPTDRNVGAPVKQVNKRPEQAYKTLPPIHDPQIALEVYKRSMEAPITITQPELLSLSPEVRSKVRDSTTTKRVPNKDALTAQNLCQGQDDDQVDEYPPIDVLAYDRQRTPPPGSYIAADPIENYYKSLGQNEDPDFEFLLVAKDSSAVRSVVALVDNLLRTVTPRDFIT